MWDSQADYWKKLWNQLKDGPHAPSLEPQFLIDEYLADQDRHEEN